MRKTVIVLLIIGTLLFTFLALSTYRKATILVDEPARITRIVNRASLLERIRDQLSISVVAARRYLLTGDETYLGPYHEAIPGIRDDFKQIRQEHILRPALYERLNKLESFVNERLSVLAQSIDHRRKDSYTPRLRRFYTASGAALDKEINLAIDGWISEDIRLSERLGLELTAALKNMIGTAIWGIGLTILLLALLFMLNRARNRALMDKHKAVQDARLSEGLAKTQKFFTHILDTLPGPVMYADKDLICQQCNHACRHVLGHSENELIGKSVADIMSGNPLMMEGFEKTRSTGLFSKQVIAFRSPSKPESELFYDVSFAADEDNSGGIAGIIASGTDVTELVKIQRELDKRVEARTKELTKSSARTAESEANLRTILESVYDGIFIHDENGKILDVNKKMLEMYGLTYEQAVGSSIANDLSAPDSPRGELERLWNKAMSGETVLMEWHARRPSDGTVFPVEVFLRKITLKARDAILASVRDITERKKTEQALRELNRDFVIFLENTTDFVYFKDGNSRFRFCSQTVANITGHSSWRDMIGKHDLEVFPEEVAQIYYEEELPVFLNGIPLLNKIDPYYDAQGKKGWLSTNKWPVFDDENKVIGIFGMSRDITEHKKMEEEIRHMAHHDALTDLPNRPLFSDILALEMAQARRNRKKMALLFLDLDRFKDINDTLGHEVGDHLLKEVARRLRETIRESDTVARIGGDEFNILLADVIRVEDISDIAGKIISRFRTPFLISGRDLYVTTSIGISIYPDDSVESEALLRYADMAMYHAKERGRNTYQFYNPAINIRSIERMRLENMLRRSIERHELVLHYQPQINILSKEMVRAEALVRWQHPERGLLPPHEFLPFADETGFITEIDDWALKTVCEQMRSWLNSGMANMCITVNLSSRQFQRPGLAARIGAVLKETGIMPECLDIDITENTAMRNIETSAEQLRELRAMGVHISIDDFGTGYSSLKYLKKLPIEHLKIDKTFVEDITMDADDRAIISAVTSMARKMGIRTVAEGVETEEQLSFLRTTDCDEAQGYLIGRPLAAKEFKEKLTLR